MNDTNAPGAAENAGSPICTSESQSQRRHATTRHLQPEPAPRAHLEAALILPVPICRRAGVIVDLEHASDYEFRAWLVWNGIPFRGESAWTFDGRCAVVNHVAAYVETGVKLRLVAEPTASLALLKQFGKGIVSELFTELFVWPGSASLAASGDSNLTEKMPANEQAESREMDQNGKH